MMSTFIKTIHDALKETIVGTLSLCFIASNVIEKICWLVMWILGSIYMIMIISDQFESWNLNPTISSRKLIDLSEVEAPAITFCHQGNTRLEVADRLLQAAGDNNGKVRKLRNRFLKHSVEKLLHLESIDWLGFSRFEQNPKKIKAIYKEKCHQDSADSACQDCLCDIYNIAFSFAKKHNLTIEELYEKLFFILNAEDNISNGLTKIWTDIRANTSEIYKIDFSDGELV
jgi:hypothetical protein